MGFLPCAIKMTSAKCGGVRGQGLLYFLGSFSCSIAHFFLQFGTCIEMLAVPYSRPQMKQTTALGLLENALIILYFLFIEF